MSTEVKVKTLESQQVFSLPVMPEYTVSSLSTALKRTVEENYTHVRVRGEVSGAKLHSSGHCYFCLKDADAVIDAMCWRPVVSKLGFQLEDGMDVICVGRVTTYPGRSKYQIVVESVELAGEGALLKLLEERKKRLHAEGLFDSSRKKPIPFLPRCIGIITSPTGAVIRDILHRLKERFPTHVVLWPVLVQGETAASQVAAAIRGFNELGGVSLPKPDVVIVARGGGSLEDLWAFNDEGLVRAVAASIIPIISAVGHETDTTLIDFAADLRAPTPTAAAEKAVPVRTQLRAQLQDLESRLMQAGMKVVEQRSLLTQHLGHRLPKLSNILLDYNQRLDDWVERLQRGVHFRWTQAQTVLTQRGLALRQPTALIDAWQMQVEHIVHRFQQAAVKIHSQAQQNLNHASTMLHSLAPARVLERGYVIVKSVAGQRVITKAVEATNEAELELCFQDGTMVVQTSTTSQNKLQPASPVVPPKVQGHLW